MQQAKEVGKIAYCYIGEGGEKVVNKAALPVKFLPNSGEGCGQLVS